MDTAETTPPRDFSETHEDSRCISRHRNGCARILGKPLWDCNGSLLCQRVRQMQKKEVNAQILKGGDTDGRQKEESLRVWLHALHPKRPQTQKTRRQKIKEVRFLPRTTMTGGGELFPPLSIQPYQMKVSVESENCDHISKLTLKKWKRWWLTGGSFEGHDAIISWPFCFWTREPKSSN